jgi:hypothetical protein
MVTVTESIILQRPPNEVFDIVADPHRQLEWDSGTLQSVEILTPGPLAQGARVQAQMRGLGSVEYEFAEYEPGQRFAHRGTNRLGEVYHRFEFEAVAEGTRLTQTSTLTPKGIGHLLAPFMRGMLRNRLRTMNQEIDGYLRTHEGE